MGTEEFLQKRIAIERGEMPGDWERRAKPRMAPRLKKLLYTLSAGFLRASGLYWRGRRNAANPVTNLVDLEFPSLPASFDGFRVLHLSDFHGQCVPGLAEKVAAVVGGLEVDLCVLTGDYQQEPEIPFEDACPAIETVLSAMKSRNGIIAVLGNVDSIETVQPLEKMGVRVLLNDHWLLERGNDSICWMGLDDPHDYGCADLDGTISRAPKSSFRALLVHTPELATEAAAHAVDLYLCGHTHGGQVCLPGIGPLRRNTNCDKRLTSGAWQVDGMRGYTSRGLGVAGIPVRFMCPPEIAVLRLLRGS